MARLLVISGLVLAAVAAIAIVVFKRGPVDLPAAGVSQALAVNRSARVSSLRYAVTLQVPSERSAPIAGTLTATFTLLDASSSLAFDFAQSPDALQSVAANGRSVSAAVENGHVMIPASRLREGENSVTFAFTAGDAALNRQNEYLYSLFVPARASSVMPCLDQPDLKARWQLTLDIPQGWKAVSNGRQTGSVEIAGTVGTGGGARARTNLIFDETPPLPAYLFSFAAGRFSVESGERNGRTFRVFHRETDRARMDRNLNSIVDLHAKALAWLEDYTAIPYPFGKFDMVLIPSFQFSGMEHPGSVYYNANTLLLDETATQNQQLARANTIAHETAHMWFGDLVTMRWFDDVWMKEVFANLMAAKIVNPLFPAMNHELRFLVQNYPAAYDVDRTDGTNPIRQPLDNLTDAGSLYGAIIYQKAPIAMRQLERLMGADSFRDGLRDYLSAYRFGNASWPDLVSRLDKRTGADLAAWNRAWIERAGRPTITTKLDVSNGRITRLSFVQSDARGRNLSWPQKITVIVSTRSGIHEFETTIDAAETVVPGALGLPAPSWVLPVGAGLGYGFFDLDPTTLDYLTTHVGDIRDPLTRGAAAVALWESLLEGRVTPPAVMQVLLRALPGEQDELNLQLLLDDLRAVFWRFTAPDARTALAPTIERTLRTGLDRASTATTKAAWLSTLRSVASSAETLDWLESVWRRETTIPLLPLSEVDEVDLAFDLALRGRPNAPRILAEQEARIQNPDRKARFAFIKPALAIDAPVRAAFFDSLKSVRNRGREAWVIDAVKYLHHPLRADASRDLVRPGLDLVLEIKRTGDIFFPKRWADALLSGHQSEPVATAVRTFIDSLPADYPERLRWVLLSSADPLFRAASALRTGQQ